MSDRPIAAPFSDVREVLSVDARPVVSDEMRDRANAALDAIEEGCMELVAAAESLSRPGVQTGSMDELRRGMRMTEAVQALARMAGVQRRFPGDRRMTGGTPSRRCA